MKSAVINLAHGIFFHPAFLKFSRARNAHRKKFPFSFALKFEVFLVEMSASELLQCYNKGCGKEYREEENAEGNECLVVDTKLSYENLVEIHAVTHKFS